MKVETIIESTCQIFSEIFSKNEVNTAAKRTKFSKRKVNKLDGYAFFVAMTLGRFKKSGQHFNLHNSLCRLRFN